MQNYKQKYLKYKTKYLKAMAEKQNGGFLPENESDAGYASDTSLTMDDVMSAFMPTGNKSGNTFNRQDGGNHDSGPDSVEEKRKNEEAKLTKLQEDVKRLDRDIIHANDELYEARSALRAKTSEDDKASAETKVSDAEAKASKLNNELAKARDQMNEISRYLESTAPSRGGFMDQSYGAGANANANADAASWMRPSSLMERAPTPPRTIPAAFDGQQIQEHAPSEVPKVSSSMDNIMQKVDQGMEVNPNELMQLNKILDPSNSTNLVQNEDTQPIHTEDFIGSN